MLKKTTTTSGAIEIDSEMIIIGFGKEVSSTLYTTKRTSYVQPMNRMKRFCMETREDIKGSIFHLNQLRFPAKSGPGLANTKAVDSLN